MVTQVERGNSIIKENNTVNINHIGHRMVHRLRYYCIMFILGFLERLAIAHWHDAVVCYVHCPPSPRLRKRYLYRIHIEVTMGIGIIQWHILDQEKIKLINKEMSLHTSYYPT